MRTISLLQGQFWNSGSRRRIDDAWTHASSCGQQNRGDKPASSLLSSAGGGLRYNLQSTEKHANKHIKTAGSFFLQIRDTFFSPPSSSSSSFFCRREGVLVDTKKQHTTNTQINFTFYSDLFFSSSNLGSCSYSSKGGS